LIIVIKGNMHGRGKDRDRATREHNIMPHSQPTLASPHRDEKHVPEEEQILTIEMINIMWSS